jgi:Inosine-uridine nucleoside N-ribohydrolase
MKKTLFLPCLAALAVLAFGCREKHVEEQPLAPMSVIFETDLGNDIDDAMALDLLYKYMDEGRINLLGVMVNKVEEGAAEYVDIARAWYGYPDVPIGVIREGADCHTDAVNYAACVALMKNEDGTPVFPGTGADISQLPLAVDLYREILSQQPDTSVTVISVGFSTNLARLLDSPADQWSELDGRQLVEKKVRRLVTMAGCMSSSTIPEYNVIKDIPSAQKVAREWPTELITSPFEVGIAIEYPGKSIEEDFSWAEHHPMVEGYKAYLPMPYDRPTWDLTSVLYAVEGMESNGVPYFTVQGPGTIDYTDEAFSVFTPDPAGNRYYLSVDSVKAANVLGHFKEMLVAEPAVFATE